MVDINTLDDESFAELSGDAEWLHSQQLTSMQAGIINSALTQKKSP